jgi:hypothetical protein
MNDLKQFIASIINDNGQSILAARDRGVELVTIDLNHNLILDKIIDEDQELASTCMESDDTLEEITDFLVVDAVSSEVTKRLFEDYGVLQVWDIPAIFKTPGYNLLIDLAVQLIKVGYSRSEVELVAGEKVPHLMSLALAKYDSALDEKVSVFLREFYEDNKPLPEETETHFTPPTPETINTDGWWEVEK